jgi:pimeloyl-ACP methyl ester carboxylesterase
VPYASNDGTRIHYEVEGNGPPLILQHGTTGSWEDWEEFGYVTPLREKYRLILIDARGHGASDKPHDPAAYDLSMRAADVVVVLNDLGIRQASFLGYSLGGWIGFGMAKYAPERLTSLIIGGAHPYSENMQPFRDVMPRDVDAFMVAMERIYGPSLSPALRARLRSNDLEALLAMTQDRPSLADILPTMTMPCLLFVGESDPRLENVRKCATELRNATFFSLPGCDHVRTFASSGLVLPHVQAFLSKDNAELWRTDSSGAIR